METLNSPSVRGSPGLGMVEAVGRQRSLWNVPCEGFSLRNPARASRVAHRKMTERAKGKGLGTAGRAVEGLAFMFMVSLPLLPTLPLQVGK